MKMAKNELIELLNDKSLRHFGCYLDEATQ